LYGAVFNFATLDDCEGIEVLLIDPRHSKGYILAEWNNDGQPWYNSGCRSFNQASALDHWGSDNYPDKERGRMYVDAIDAAKQQEEE